MACHTVLFPLHFLLSDTSCILPNSVFSTHLCDAEHCGYLISNYPLKCYCKYANYHDITKDSFKAKAKEILSVSLSEPEIRGTH